MSKNNGLTNNGLDDLATVGTFETSRSYRNDRDFLTSINQELVKGYARKSVPQVTFDKMDICISGTMHHLTLGFLEFETILTHLISQLSPSLLMKHWNSLHWIQC